MDGFLYPARDLYRPGETMYIAGIIRTYSWEVLPRIPVKLKVLSPSGKEFKSLKKTLDDQGGFETGIVLPKTATTGTYTVELYTSNDVLLTTSYISVEEFMPDRIKVSSNLNKKEYYPGDEVKTSIKADNLYGTPAANRNWEAEINLSRSYFSSQKYSNYNFQISGGETYLSTQTTEGTTDDDGEADAAFVIPSEYVNIGLLNGRVMTTVFDESGRPVYDVKDFKVVTQNVLFGIGDLDYYTKTKQSIKIPLIALDKDDKLTSGDAKVEIIKHEYETVIEKNRTYYTYRSNKVEKLQSTQTISIKGENTAVWFTPQLSGEYEIRVKFPNSGNSMTRDEISRIAPKFENGYIVVPRVIET